DQGCEFAHAQRGPERQRRERAEGRTEREVLEPVAPTWLRLAAHRGAHAATPRRHGSERPLGDRGHGGRLHDGTPPLQGAINGATLGCLPPRRCGIGFGARWSLRRRQFRLTLKLSGAVSNQGGRKDRKSTRLNSSHVSI